MADWRGRVVELLVAVGPRSLLAPPQDSTTNAIGAFAPPGASAGGDVTRACHVSDGGVRHEEATEGVTHSAAILGSCRGLHRLPIGRATGF